MTDPIIETKLGKVIGRVAHTTKDIPYYSFQGMKYAEPPLGDLRFKAPKPAKPWDGIWNAQKEGNRSLSYTAEGEIIGDEDCLFLNVYTPKLPSDTDEPLPVMVWLHSGGFYLGSGGTDLYSPDYLMNQDVVIVTINYRLCALGGIQFKDPRIRAPGNASFKDMVMALRWVQENIRCFNGDPNNVTVWGQSAGAIAASLMIVSPMAKGLFHRAIIQSGTSIVGYNTPHRPIADSFLFCRHAGFETNDELEAYKFLRNLSAEEITKAFKSAMEWTRQHYEALVGPIIELPCGDEPLFIDQEPELYYLRKEINAVPIIIGCNLSDGMVYVSKEHADGFIPPNFPDVQHAVPKDLLLKEGSAQCIEFGNEIIKFYYGEATPTRRNLDKYIKFQTDLKYNKRIRRLVKLHQYATDLPVYVYRFDFESPQNLYKRLFNVQLPGVSHGDDLTYLWHTKYPVRIRPGSAEDRVQHRMITLWTNFAKRADPNPEIPDRLINVKWHPAHDYKVNHLNIGKYLTYKEDGPEQERMNFWDELDKKFYRQKFSRLFGENIDENLLENIVVQVRLLKYEFLTEKEKEFGFGIRSNR